MENAEVASSDPGRMAALEARLASLENALAEEGRRADALNRIAAAIGSGGDLAGVVQAVVDGGVELTGAAFGAFFYNLISAEGESYTLYALSGAPRSAFEGYPMPRATDVFLPTFKGEGVVRSDNITLDPRYGRNAPHEGMPAGHLPVCSYLAAPVVSRSGDVLGGLFFGHPQEAIFGRRLEGLVAGLAAQAAVAIDNVRLNEAARREVEERRRADERQRLLLNELNHRVKNTLATVQSIASQTLRGASDTSAFKNAFEARLLALSQTHNLLTDESWEAASLHDILRLELRPHAGGREGGGSRFELQSNGDVRLAPKAAVALGMAVHELATNAVKYGALSTPAGLVAVKTHVDRQTDAPRLTVEWIESGGPVVTKPQRRGFGGRLLEQGLAGELAGRVELDYRPEGLICRMELPMQALEPSE